MKRNKAKTLPPPEQRTLPGERQHQVPARSSRRHSQPTPAPRHPTDPKFRPHSNPPPRNSHRRTSQPLPILQETSHPNMTPPPSPPQRPRRVSSPPMSTLPSDKPRRSNAIRRESQSHSPTQATSTRVSLLAQLRNAQPLDSTNFTRYPASRPGSGIGSPPRNSQIRPPPSPRTPTFVNTHMLPPPTDSPRSDVEEWASAVSSFSPNVRTKRL